METKSFIEWLQHLRKPTPTELFLKQHKEMHFCVGNCGKMVHGWTAGHECMDCFMKRVNSFKAFVYI